MNCTVVDNESLGIDGTPLTGGLLVEANFIPDLSIANTIFWNNSPNQIYSEKEINPTYCIIQDGYVTGTQITDSDPLFIGGGNYHIIFGSPCIDSGTSLKPDILNDIDGDLRPMGTRFDIGADEYAF